MKQVPVARRKWNNIHCFGVWPPGSPCPVSHLQLLSSRVGCRLELFELSGGRSKPEELAVHSDGRKPHRIQMGTASPLDRGTHLSRSLAYPASYRVLQPVTDGSAQRR